MLLPPGQSLGYAQILPLNKSNPDGSLKSGLAAASGNVLSNNTVPSKRSEFKNNYQATLKAVTGKVTSEAGEPLIGVTVVVKGTTVGTSTDATGNYSIEVPNDGGTLVFSYIGFLTKEVLVGNATTLNVTLATDAKALEEVVVVGYGTQKKETLTGSVASVNGELLTTRPVTNPTAAIQGRMPGVRIVQNSGEPGNEGASIRIRGIGTFSGAGSNPLVLIDGVEGNLSNLDPNNIESISVLKDAASASIYGSRAANGVVLVTTKQGKEGEINLEYNGNYGIHTPTKMLDLITNSAEYMELWNEAKQNTGITSGLYTPDQIALYRNATDRNLYPNADWVDIVFNPAPTQIHNLSFNGGSKGTRFFVALGHVNQQGVMKGFDYKKYNGQFNITSQINKNIQFGTNISLMKGDRQATRQGSEDAFLATLSQAPTYSPWLPDGSGRYSFKAYSFESNNKNPLAIIENEVLRNTDDYNFNVQGWTDVKLFKGLNWYTKAAVVGNFTEWNDWRPLVPLYNFHSGDFMSDLDVGGQGLINQTERNIYTNLYTYLKYEKELGAGHLINTQLGFSQEENNYRFLNGYRRNFTSNNLRELNAGSPAVQNSSGSSNEWALQSFFGRLGYNYKERYLLEFNLRYDGTSRLHADNRWGLFPSFSTGWRVSEESFVKNAGLNWLDEFKIRGSYGKLGNQNIGIYPYQSILGLTGNYPFDNTNLSSGVAQTSLANQDIRWEATKITDIGLDMTIFRGLSLTFDWYKKVTTDILRSSQVTGIVGLNPPTVNNGTMANTGVEIGLQYRNEIKSGVFEGLTYNVGINADHFKNELTHFGAREIGGTTIKEEGRPWDTFYMLEWDGIFQSTDEIAASPKQYNDNTVPGDLKFKDQNGDNIINDDDRVPLAGRYPNLNYALNFNTAWKGFDLSFFFQGESGRKIYANNWGTIPFVQGTPPTTDWRDRWTPDNPSTTMPRIYWGFNAPSKITRSSTYFLEDAAYLRLKNLTLGYTIPATLVNRIKVKRLRIFVSGDNMLTFSDFPGLDPERAESGNLVRYPQNKIYSAGVNVQF
ncbi:TonB-dependent receptor [Adhaeribacter rhizoryzae]|uniref:TonB-dependent receptor n=2 Tax=Adhaeribacter rhizoryzae TaxID=2607907 RepID=A0A5M6DKR0_9BACT|nr:TonB-dependent receptor [Adhaeribacter rhizoryzae]